MEILDRGGDIASGRMSDSRFIDKVRDGGFRMAKTEQKLIFKARLEAPPAQVFYLFSTPQGWRDWLCNSARFETHDGGSYQLAWNSGWYTAGSIVKIKAPDRVQLVWQGKGDPGPTEVSVAVRAAAGGSEVKITHQGFGRGKTWAVALEEARKGWEAGLENLVSVVNKGPDLRITRRPIIGVVVSDFNEKIAARLGVPVTKGARIDHPIAGMGAERAGIRADDVIVRFGTRPVTGFTSIPVSLQGKRAGDVVPVVFYRGSQKHSVKMELSPRPVPEFPVDPSGLAERLRGMNRGLVQELRNVFEGASETEAGYCPGGEEWSAKENVAHLIVSEIGSQTWISDLVNNDEKEFTDLGGNVRAQLQAMVGVTPNLPALLQRYEDACEETALLLAKAEALRTRKAPLWRLGYNLLQVGDHTRGHIDQIKIALDAARKA
jgi:uncharacterized protein YndB with AHSA1/START domain